MSIARSIGDNRGIGHLRRRLLASVLRNSMGRIQAGWIVGLRLNDSLWGGQIGGLCILSSAHLYDVVA